MEDNHRDPTPVSTVSGLVEVLRTVRDMLINLAWEENHSIIEKIDAALKDSSVSSLSGDMVDKATAWDQAIKSGQNARAKALEDAINAVKVSAGGDFVMTGPAGILLRAVAAIRALSATATEGE